MRWRCCAPALLILQAAPSFAQEPEPLPALELLEFLGDWQAGEEVVLDDAADVVPLPSPAEDKR